MVRSVARGIAQRKSDIDIVVELGQPVSLLTFIKLKQELEQVLNQKVDLVEKSAIKPALREEILAHEINILG